jgi:ubiquinone/menaquinone biosynthesis C-methylase UbiE
MTDEANRRYWDALADDWQKLRDQDQLWRNCPHQPELAFDGDAYALIGQFLGDLHDKRACVLGSGDNYVAFALAGMGADVTSTDISARQLEHARRRAVQLGLDIQFLRTDACVLQGISDNQFDLVCSSNGFFVWIKEPAQVFRQAYRVLKPGGLYIFYDVHPYLRPWKDQVAPLEMEKPYTASGPFQNQDHGQTSYEYHWRLSDLLNPLLEAGLLLRRLSESPASDSRFWEGYSYAPGMDADLLDWQVNPRAGLPAWLTVAAQKPARSPVT